MSNLVDARPLTVNTAANPWNRKAPVSNETHASSEHHASLPQTAAADQPRFIENSTKLSNFFCVKLGEVTGNCLSSTLKGDKALEVFKGRSSSATDSVETQVDLSRVTVTGVANTQLQNELPFPVKITFTGPTSNHFDMTGKNFPLSITSGENARGHNSVLFSAKSGLESPLFQKYGHVSHKSMQDALQTIDVSGTKITLVPKNHEVIKLIEKNPSKWGDLKNFTTFRDMYEVNPSVVDEVMKAISDNIISKFKFVDFSAFKVEVRRIDDRNFNDLTGTKWEHMDAHDKSFHMNRNLDLSFDLVINWSAPPLSSPRGNQSSNSVSVSKIPVAVPTPR